LFYRQQNGRDGKCRKISKFVLQSQTAKQVSNFMVRFDILMATCMKMAVFWDVAACSLVDTDQCFREAYCIHKRDFIDQLSN
jgi:hypothetical protein